MDDIVDIVRRLFPRHTLDSSETIDTNEIFGPEGDVTAMVACQDKYLRAVQVLVNAKRGDEYIVDVNLLNSAFYSVTESPPLCETKLAIALTLLQRPDLDEVSLWHLANHYEFQNYPTLVAAAMKHPNADVNEQDDVNGHTVATLLCRTHRSDGPETDALCDALCRAIDDGRLAWSLNLKSGDGLTALHYTALTNNVKLMRSLMTWSDIDVASTNMDRFTPIMTAVALNYEEYVRYFRDACDAMGFMDTVNCQGWDGETALTLAISAVQSVTLTKLVLSIQSVDVNLKTHNGDAEMTPLMRACRLKKSNVALAITAVLLDAGALTDSIDDKGNNAMIWATAQNHVGVLELLVRKEAENGQQSSAYDEGEDGYTAFMTALENKTCEAARFFIRHDLVGDVNAQNAMDQTLLMIACINGHLDIASWLLDHGACRDLVDSKGKTTLMHSSLAMARLLLRDYSSGLRRQAYVDAVDEHGRTALSFAAASQYGASTVSFLIESGASNVACNQKKTPLMWAIIGDSVETARVLLETWPESVNVRDGDGNTPLMKALKLKRRKIAPLIARCPGVDLNAKDGYGYGWTPLMIAIRMTNLHTMRVILERGSVGVGSNRKYGAAIDVNAVDIEGNTALMFAMQTQCRPIIDELMRRRSLRQCVFLPFGPLNLNQRNKDGKTAMDIAKENQFYYFKDTPSVLEVDQAVLLRPPKRPRVSYEWYSRPTYNSRFLKTK